MVTEQRVFCWYRKHSKRLCHLIKRPNHRQCSINQAAMSKQSQSIRIQMDAQEGDHQQQCVKTQMPDLDCQNVRAGGNFQSFMDEKLRTGRVVSKEDVQQSEGKDSEVVKNTDIGIASCRSEPNYLTSLGLT